MDQLTNGSMQIASEIGLANGAPADSLVIGNLLLNKEFNEPTHCELSRILMAPPRNTYLEDACASLQDGA